MAQNQKHIYRSSQGVLGGVCAGVAERFDLDYLLVRILVVLLCVVTLGGFSFIYLAAWLIFSAEPSSDDTVNIDPSSFKSEVYDQVVNRPAAQTAGAMASAAYLPPTPPSAASAYYAAPTQAPYGTAAPATSERSRSTVTIGLVLGGLLIALGAAVLFSSISGRFSAIQFWPLALVVFGVIRIAIPAKDGSRSATTWLGAFLVIVGIVALASSLGVYVIVADLWAARAAPFLVVAVGLFVMGRAAHSDLLIVLAAIAVVAFLCAGMYFGLRDTAVEIGTSLPFTPETFLDMSDE